MKKKVFIERRGEDAYKRRLEQNRQWYIANREKRLEQILERKKANPDRVKQYARQWRKANPEKVEELSHNQHRKGGKYYEKKLRYDRSGLRGERNGIRRNHQYMWGQYKKILAPNSQLHHQWLPGAPEYSGVALVEANQHMYGIIDVIRILEGEITLFTEEEVRNQVRV